MNIVRQVVKFVLSHNEVFCSILRDRHTTLNLEALQELALTTAVIGRTALDGEIKMSLAHVPPKYDNLWHSLFSKITDINLNVLSERDKFVKILKFYQKYLANYIMEAFEIRQKLVFNSNNWYYYIPVLICRDVKLD